MDWVPYKGLSEEDYHIAKTQSHLALQNIAAVGRAFNPSSEEDGYAILHWVPGFWRMAGSWVEGEKKFRASLSFKDFCIYLVDQKVSVLASYEIYGKNNSQIRVWLEEQIMSLGLGNKDIHLELPYQLPYEFDSKRDLFQKVTPQIYFEFGKLYHNTYQVLIALKDVIDNTSDIEIKPEFFDISMSITLKETGEKATNTMLTLGFSPGDQSFDMPYFYVRTWPHVDVESIQSLSSGIWYAEEWSGAMIKFSLINDNTDPAGMLKSFFLESFEKTRDQLLA